MRLMFLPGVKESPADRRKNSVETWVSVLVVLALLSGLVAWLEVRPRQRELPIPRIADARDTWVRVLLLADVECCTLQNAVGLSPRDVPSGNPIPIGANEKSRDIEIGLSPGGLTLAGVAADTHHLEIRFLPPHIFSIEGERYRGRLEVIVDETGLAFDVINSVRLEPYLAGVVGAEMPAYWAPEALKAQAIASRSYCLYTKNRFGRHRAWDVGQTQAHQVYRGVAAETATVWEAIRATEGQVLVTRTADGAPIVMPTYYSAICGGHTEDSNQVFGEASTGLRGVDCWSCEDIAGDAQFNWPTVVYTKEDVSRRLLSRYAALAALETIEAIEPLRQSEYDQFTRVTQVRLVGRHAKTAVLRAEDLRLAIDPSGRRIKSTGCRLEDRGDRWAFVQGRGWGHGVGMCQCGAQGLARAGLRAEDILTHYYPGAVIERVP